MFHSTAILFLGSLQKLPFTKFILFVDQKSKMAVNVELV